MARSATTLSSFCAWDGDTLVLNILGQPSAKRDAIGKPKGHQLKVSVTEAPVAGRATDHMVRFLAGQFGVAVGDIEVVLGVALMLYVPATTHSAAVSGFTASMSSASR